MDIKFETADFRVPEFAIYPLMMNDYSGLDNDDADSIKAFQQDIIDRFGIGHWSWEDEIPEFTRYHDLRPYGIEGNDCVIITWNFRI